MTDFIRERVCLYSPPLKHIRRISELILLAQKYGVAGIELLSFYEELATPNLEVARGIARDIRAAGLVIPCFSVGAILYGDTLTHDYEMLKRYAEICSELRVPYLHHTIFLPFDKKDIPKDTEDVFKVGVEAALKLNEYARTLGVATVVEDQGMVFNGKDNYGRLMRETDYKIGTVLDLGNIMFVDELADSFAEAFIDNVKQVHIKDYAFGDTRPDGRFYLTRGNRYLMPREIGTGDAPHERVAEILKGSGYDGYYSIEFDKPENVDELRRALLYVDRVYGNN